MKPFYSLQHYLFHLPAKASLCLRCVPLKTNPWPFSPPCNPSFLVQPLHSSPGPAVPIYLPARDEQQSWDETLLHRTPHLTAPRKLALWKNIHLAGCKIHHLCPFALNPPRKSCSCCAFNHQGVLQWESSCGQRRDQNPRVWVQKKG